MISTLSVVLAVAMAAHLIGSPPPPEIPNEQQCYSDGCGINHQQPYGSVEQGEPLNRAQPYDGINFQQSVDAE